jgi:hypothetical protein
MRSAKSDATWDKRCCIKTNGTRDEVRWNA